jgi:hypothetical protein
VSTPGPGEQGPAPDDAATPAEDAPQRRWVWMDRWDPGTWEMPQNPTRSQRVMAGVCLVIILVMTIFVPLKILGIL